MCTVRPGDLAAVARPGRPARPCSCRPNEQVSVENLLHGIVTLSGNDASVVLAECIAGTEQAFAAQMNALGKKLGLTNSNFGNSQRLARRGRDLCHRARPGDAGPGHDRAPSQALQAILRPAELHLGQDPGRRAADHPGQPQPAPRQGRRRRRAQDRPHRGGGLRLHRLGRAERPPPGDGRRRARQLQPADRGIGPADELGLQRLDRQAACSPPGRNGRQRARSSSAASSEVGAGRAAQPRGDLARGPRRQPAG